MNIGKTYTAFITEMALALNEAKGKLRHVFSDFDETLATDKARVRIGKRSLSAAEFSAYKPEPNDPKPDFSEFSKTNQPVIKNKHFAFRVFKNAARKLAKRKDAGDRHLPVIGIITARPKEATPHIRQWLRDNGVHNAGDVHIHAVGSVHPQAKVDAIRKHIHSGSIKSGDQVHFFDDHAPNVHAVSGMQKDHEHIKIRSVHVGEHRKKRSKNK